MQSDENQPQPGSEPPEPFVSEPDVAGLHTPLRREPLEPEEGAEPPPWWLWAGVVVALFVGGFYLGRHSGPFAPVAHVGNFVSGTEAPVPPDKGPTAAVDGGKVYTARCAACHQPGGEGVPGTFPPIAGSEWVTGDAEVLIKLVAYGMEGPVTVAGQTYNGVMPAWKPQLTPEEIAAVISHERQMGGNGAGEVTADQVKQVLEAVGERGPYKADELKGGS